MKKIILAALLAVVTFSSAFAHEPVSAPSVQTVQPKIMVIPYTKEGEDIRTILESDVNKRIVLTKIKEAFDSRGFTTVDFIAKLKAARDNNIFTSDNQTDLKAQIVQMSGADVYVEAEDDVLLSSTGNSVKIILTAYEISTGNSLANKVGRVISSILMISENLQARQLRVVPPIFSMLCRRNLPISLTMVARLL